LGGGFPDGDALGAEMLGVGLVVDFVDEGTSERRKAAASAAGLGR